MSKLSFRLKKIKNLISSESNIVWDLCCDHGQLGKSLLQNKQKVYFVDIVPHIIDELKQSIVSSNCEFQAKDATKIIIENRIDESIIMAGVGGWTCIKILDSLINNYTQLKSEFILAPQKNLQTVKDYLLKNDFTLISEDIIQDKKNYYNILKVRRKAYAYNISVPYWSVYAL